MMICKADFEELFPEVFKPGRRPLAQVPEAAPERLIAWPEADGGRPQLRHPDPLSIHPQDAGGAGPDATRTILALAALSAAAAYGGLPPHAAQHG